MPNCFQLYKKGEEEPTVLQNIDDELWLKFTGSVPEPNKQWYSNWYGSVGLMLSCGQSFQEIKETLSVSMGPVIDYLNENYTQHAWYEHK
jgi:hypothetical protein